MIEIRWHGRGGQGVVTAANILGAAAMHAGRYAQSFPFFGAERRGAPVAAYTRIADSPVRVRSQIYNPDWVVVLDDSLFEIVNPLDGLKRDGGLVVNTKRPAMALPTGCRIFSVDATTIAQDTIGRPVANTAMLGALVAVGMIDMDSLLKAIVDAFPGSAGQKNVEAARSAFAAVASLREAVRG